MIENTFDKFGVIATEMCGMWGQAEISDEVERGQRQLARI